MSGIPACLEPLLEDWPRMICVLVHAIIAFHVTAMLFAGNLAALKVNPLMAGRSGQTTAASKSKYYKLSRLSILLSCFGAVYFATGQALPTVTGFVCFEKETVVWPCLMPLVSHSNQVGLVLATHMLL